MAENQSLKYVNINTVYWNYSLPPKRSFVGLWTHLYLTDHIILKDYLSHHKLLSFLKCVPSPGSLNNHASSLYSEWAFYPVLFVLEIPASNKRNCFNGIWKELGTEKALHTGDDPETSVQAIP